jgi:ligand-binding SRPBCC domain-containing protein
VIVNVCPSGIAAVPPEKVWQVISTPERFGEWVDATVVAVQPVGLAVPGQRIELTTPFLGRQWPISIDVVGVDPNHRWIDLQVQLPFGVVNAEHLTLTEWEGGRTLVRFN